MSTDHRRDPGAAVKQVWLRLYDEGWEVAGETFPHTPGVLDRVRHAVSPIWRNHGPLRRMIINEIRERR